MCLQGLRATGLVDFPYSVEEQANSERESSLPRVPQQISGRTALGPEAPNPHPGPHGCGWAKWEADPHSSNLTPSTPPRSTQQTAHLCGQPCPGLGGQKSSLGLLR